MNIKTTRVSLNWKLSVVVYKLDYSEWLLSMFKMLPVALLYFYNGWKKWRVDERKGLWFFWTI